MIKSIYLENWKTHHKTTMDFEKGTNVIVGQMGSGKSSIMDAISFALYGTYPGVASRKVSLEETLMLKPFKADEAKVKLEFDYNEKEYTIERILRKKGTNEAKLVHEGKIIAGPKTTDVTKKVSEILEVNYDLFSRAIYSEQNQIDFFLKLSPSQRKEKFDELLGLNKYETARSNCVSVANRLKKIIDDKKSFLEEQKRKADAKQLEEYEKRVIEKEKELKKKVEESKEIEKKEKEAKFYRELEIKSKSKIESFNEEIKKTKEKIANKKLADIEKEIEKEEKEEKMNLEKLEKIEKDKKSAEEKVSKISEEIAVNKNILKTNEKAINEFDSIGAKCPTCKRTFEEHDKKEACKGFEETNEKVLKLLAELEKKIEIENKEKEIILKEKNKIEEIREKLRKELQELKNIKEKASELEEKEKQKILLENELKIVIESAKKISFDEEKLRKERKEHSELREKNAKINAEIKSGKELVKELEESIKRIKETEKQIKELEEKIKKHENAVEKLAIFTSALKSTQAELRSVMIETINEAMDEIWTKVYPYADFSSAKIIAQEGNYEIMVKQLNDEWVRVEGILSGGERSTAALTIRIAVSLVLTQNLGWIILDEPTHNLDANAVRELSETMRNHFPELIDQIFIITHDKEMENAATGRLYTLERKKESDGVTTILGS